MEFPVICAEQGIFSFFGAALILVFSIIAYLQYLTESAIGSLSTEQGITGKLRRAAAIHGATRSMQNARP